jgi:hypothetical protein
MRFLAVRELPTFPRVMLACPSLWLANSGLSALDCWLCGASLCSLFSNFRFGIRETGSICDGDRFAEPTSTKAAAILHAQPAGAVLWDRMRQQRLLPCLRIFRPEPIDNGRNRHNHNLCKRRLTYNFFLKDRCALPDQISFSLTSSRRAYILAMRYRNRSN